MSPRLANGTPASEAHAASGYWFDASAEERSVAVLNALRDYRTSETAMRQRTRDSMGMGDTDLKAIRFLLAAQRRGETVNARELADHLGITTPSTSVLIKRLVSSGHLERRAHPTDRRGVLLTATEGSDDEVRATMAGMHARMITAAEALSPEEARVVTTFLRAMATALEPDAEPHSPTA
ncbi:Multiple antibiotic resistance protein MarR [Frondihabitans sp. 762G35]|uniref:MarR family winged helix-turn-helix transcriptional regulator n=1 Tax=Frondihabitans sp. 762G35 TaxID=1446794 RepID=UPI000D21F0AB|nr:MarR family transcriptional regulator [Frondihabitans sp. 762G35]ARC58354.1 Multiple antibiotic resistance protein MarR [Frondihabitans sp. 762G35]